MSTALNAVRREQISIASGVYAVVMQVGGAFGVSMMGTALQRREFFHYAHYLQQISDVFPSSGSQALAILQELLLKCGHEPAGILVEGKRLLASWIYKQAAAAAFQDAFFLLGFFVVIGTLPALLIRKGKSPT